MNIYQKESLKLCLKGNILRRSLNLIGVRILKTVFILYCVSVFYLLIFDTSLIADIGLYENKYVAAAVCLFAVITGVILFFLSLWQSFRCKLKTYSLIENVSVPQFSLNPLFKYLALRFYVAVYKLTIASLIFTPTIALTAGIYKLLSNGINTYVLAILSVCDVILLVNSLVCSVCLLQRFALCDYCFAENTSMTVREIIKESAYLMDGRLIKTGEYKLSHFILNVFGLLIPSFSVRQTCAQFLISTDKIIPYAHRKAHTEKPIVFYFDKKATVN